ncbi:unnamed protein product [Parnassius apollo]|uniref:(apollo) hypothetical protein n=1 Tax=Parnassius apollo TaxID=110799 RepID=A0A8S3Y0C0_PARAO|nr:unnamed protein product [Parnassius apollo]
MDAGVLDCDPTEIDRGLCACKGVPSLGILKDVQKAYEERIELIKKAGGCNKLQKELELMRSWVRDLVEQNGMLARAVEELEAEVSSRMVLEKRRSSEIESELRTEVSVLRRRLARKDSDVRGLLELLRRLRDFDHRDIGDIRFYEVTQHDIFGCTIPTDLECEDKQCDKRTSKKDFQRIMTL